MRNLIHYIASRTSNTYCHDLRICNVLICCNYKNEVGICQLRRCAICANAHNMGALFYKHRADMFRYQNIALYVVAYTHAEIEAMFCKVHSINSHD